MDLRRLLEETLRSMRLRPKMPAAHARRVERLKQKTKPISLPWRTIRDGLAGLPLPVAKEQKPSLPNHILVPGARVYPNHTGSPLDMPSKTLKAGAHGVPGGENILLSPDGAIRYFTIRECGRLQTFPDEYEFLGTEVIGPADWKCRSSDAGGNFGPGDSNAVGES